MRTFKVNQLSPFLSFSLTNKIYKPVWLIANCISDCERNYVLHEEIFTKEGVHLTLPPHIFSVQEKSAAFYITGQSGRAQDTTKET